MEQREASEKAKQRQRLGSLKDLTVQPATRKRYEKSTSGFFQFLKQEGLAIPTRKDQFNLVLCEYLEFLWSTGAGRAQANDTVAGSQGLPEPAAPTANTVPTESAAPPESTVPTESADPTGSTPPTETLQAPLC